MGKNFPPIRTYFSPGRDPQENICGFIDRTKKELLVAIFSFTDEVIAGKIKEALGRKVIVQILVDADQALSPAMARLLDGLRAAGAEIRVDRESGYMHNKYAISDRMAVITGSYNWTVRAQKRNRENLIIVRKKSKHANWRVDPVLNSFVNNFSEVWAASAPLNSAVMGNSTTAAATTLSQVGAPPLGASPPSPPASPPRTS